MTAAECLIVSAKHAKSFDAYVLSESSLFVYANKVVLKTCGTTKLLEAIPKFLSEAKALGMAPRRVKYTRSTFDRPEEQPLEGCFTRETEFLERHFGELGPDGGNAFVLGSKNKGVQWHVYVADDDSANNFVGSQSTEGSECSTQDETNVDGVPAQPTVPFVEPTVSLEVCMTELNVEHAKHFVRDGSFVSSRATSEASGIANVFPTMDIDDYVFEPCGYSMNGLNEEYSGEYSTIHITPGDGFSYASVEHSNVDLNANSAFSVSNFVEKCANVFQPGKMTFAVTCHGGRETTNAFFSSLTSTNKDLFCVGETYSRPSMCFQQLPKDQGFVAYLTFVKTCDEEVPRRDKGLNIGSVVVSESVNVGKKVAYDSRSETPMCILDAAMSSGDSSETDDSLRDSSTDEFVSYDQHDELAGQRQQRSSFV